MNQNAKIQLNFSRFFQPKRQSRLLRLSQVLCACCLLSVMIVSGCATQTIRPPDVNKADQVVRLAKSLQGTAYRYGGRTPSQGFDCSGLVQYVYQNAVGIKLPRISRQQFQVARPVRLGSEHPADLLFFDINGRGISHVGIYLGKGKFIHAPKTGGKVKISDANTKYWRKRFRGVRRLL